MVMQHLPSDAPSPRLCLIQKTYPEQEYGFNLHAERGKGQFIGNVDSGSPADLASLRSGDRIVAVNGAVVADEAHKQVVSRIKENAVQCELLVVDETAEAWYRDHDIAITVALPNVLRCAAGEQHRVQATNSPPPPDPRLIADYYDNEVSPMPPTDAQPVATHTNDVELGDTSGDGRHVYAQVVGHVHPHDERLAEPVAAAAAGGGEMVAVVTKTERDDVPPVPRLCVLQKSGDSDEFGFNLHAERARGHFIGNVDPDSIAHRAGLVLGQRIVGVNGTLVYPSTVHKVVVGLIKADPMRTQLLVASEDIDQYYSERNMEFSFANCERYGVVITNGIQTADQHFKEDSVSHRSSVVSSTSSSRHSYKDLPVHQGENARMGKVDDRSSTADSSSHRSTPPPPPPIPNQDYLAYNEHPPPIVSSTHTTAVSTERDYQVSSDTNGLSSAAAIGDNSHARSPDDPFSLSAAELRERLSRRKKGDPRTEVVSLEEKHRIVANM